MVKEDQHVDVFIPDLFYANLPAYIFGFSKNLGENVSFANCTISKHSVDDGDLILFANIAEQFNKKKRKKDALTAFIGILYENGDLNTESIRKLSDLSCPALAIEISDVKRATFFNWKVSREQNLSSGASIITYDSHNLYMCQLLETGIKNSFVDFLFDTWSSTKNEAVVYFRQRTLENITFCVELSSPSYFRRKFLSVLLYVLGIICHFAECVIQRIPDVMKKLLMLTATAKQIKCRTSHMKTIFLDVKKIKKISLLSGNLLSALVLDAACGFFITYFFHEYLQPVSLVEAVIHTTDVVVSQLQQLLYWLMGVPAGLKLNLPLNSAFGRFFLYHIYLWKTYIVLIKPLLLFMLEFSMYFKVLGLSFLISLCTDFISLATLHIYCFYGYATRIYSLMLSGLIAFWRLFRGKKWNPLRNRVDSFTYDVQQLFLGTLIFTVLIFLLPTVVLYYTVFAMLHLLVLFLQILLCKITEVLAVFPLYALVLHFSSHAFVKGDIRLKVISGTKGTVALSLEAISMSVAKVLQKTLPRQHFTVKMGFKDLLNSLIFGKIIYPL